MNPVKKTFLNPIATTLLSVEVGIKRAGALVRVGAMAARNAAGTVKY